jgi:uncharacterized membrane protein (DUF2068 family)
VSTQSVQQDTHTAASHQPAYRVIVAYKFVRGSLALAASFSLAVLTATGHAGSLQEIANRLRENATSAVGSALAHAFVTAVAPRHLWIAVAALAFDGSLTVLEGWALQRGHRWGSWLVVIVAAAFLPFEVWGLIHHPRVGRALLLLGNLLVALYLLRGSLRERKHTSA